MSSATGLHSAREELGLPNVAPHMSSSSAFMSLGGQHDGSQHSLPKPMSLSPRTFGMDDLRDFCGPLGTFKTGLTPRVFSTGLTPRSGFTPRFTTGFTPRISVTGLGLQQQQQQQQNDTNAFFSRNTGFSPRASEAPQSQKISPTGFTPKDVSAMKMPMRYPGAFNTGSNSPQKMTMGDYKQPITQLQHSQHQQVHHQYGGHHGGHHEPMNQNDMAMNMNMFDYMGRPTIHQPQHMHDPRSSKTSPISDKGSDQDDLDERRRMKNRERVRKCRKRKQDRLNFLEDRTAELEKENHVLKTKMARKSVSAAAEPMNEIQLKELRKKQNTTIASYIRAYNEVETGVFDVTARNIWSENAEILYGNNGSRVAGLEMIVSNKRASAAVFSMYKIKQYTVQWKQNSNDKCAVHWEVDVVLRPNAPQNIPMTAPFSELCAHFDQNEVLSFRMTSHLTFDEGRIVEEIRQLNLSPISELVLGKFAQDPKKASDVLRCLLVAA
ncbi:Scp extracellular protein, partial [Globisporangium splendens]